MHVLVVPSWYPTSETPLNGIYFVEQASCLADDGIKVGVVYPEQQSLRQLSWETARKKHFQTAWTMEDGVPTLRRYGWNIWSRFPPGLRCRVRTAVRLSDQYVDRFGVPDIIHAQSGRWAGAAAARMGSQFGVPYVLTEHFTGFQRDAIFPWRRPVIREGYASASGIAAVSSSLKRTLVRLNLAEAPEIEVHPNLAPVSFFTPPPSDRPAPPPFRYVTVARLSPQKNMRGLLRTFKDLSNNAEDVVLTIVGDGPERDELEKRTRHLDIRSKVSFAGRLDREGVRQALWNAHAFVLPSNHETFGVVVLEAMATGLPVVSTASGGPEDILTAETGILVPPNDQDALTEGLRKVKKKRDMFDAQAIRAYVEDEFGPKPFIRRTRLLYDRALTASPSKSPD